MCKGESNRVHNSGRKTAKMAGPPEATDRHPVVIIGGGPVGLSASILLSLRGIPHALFERHRGTSIHPKACGINQRTTEIFRAMGGGLAAVRAAAAPDDVKGRTAWWTALGPGGREIFPRDAWGGGAYADEYAAHGPTRYEVMPQNRLEPLLVRRARELNPAALRFGVEVTDLVVDEADGGGVRVKVRSSRGEESEVLARFVIAADGGRSVTDKLGVPWIGERDVMDMVSVHFRSPLRSRHPDPRNFIIWFTHPDQGGSVRTGYLYQIGPWPFDSPEARDSEEWVFSCAPTASDPSKFHRLVLPLGRCRRRRGSRQPWWAVIGQRRARHRVFQAVHHPGPSHSTLVDVPRQGRPLRSAI
ncbi:FAD binding domain-containing protein [Phialemonium atrogriseum]|uniref:FAD binding domain-containing protein n=1 Tax=Phialemonium atrogriseum TaxID=1093897 RepID=A0AAJ0BS45_9PEZI|nr:FAD binding domain-containing protein [Phialemonium atrogriseum]KAK1762109.1 FAD binding domain-containing protein [Phialemonium atrogriseum]